MINITIGELKAQALKLMGINNALDISEGDIADLQNDPTYGTYLFGMNGAINRCLGRMYVLGALQVETTRIAPKAWTEGEVSKTENNEDISIYAKDINPTLAELIPLYIVSDVFALDEPSVAQNRRNEFEQALEDYVAKSRNTNVETSEVELVYECR